MLVVWVDECQVVYGGEFYLVSCRVCWYSVLCGVLVMCVVSFVVSFVGSVSSSTLSICLVLSVLGAVVVFGVRISMNLFCCWWGLVDNQVGVLVSGRCVIFLNFLVSLRVIISSRSLLKCVVRFFMVFSIWCGVLYRIIG